MILLDTHTFVWWASDRTQLSKIALRKLEDPKEELFISVVTTWEIALLAKKERLKLPIQTSEFIEKAINHHAIQELNITREITIAAVQLPDLHNDPFDRIIIAEAMRHNCLLVTKDEKIAKYPDIQTVW